jgi:two-component system, chemotaxis family, protein-glutamate methylesterase/glutaminase
MSTSDTFAAALAHDIIVIGTSAGGAEALQALVRGLPPELKAAIFIVQHFPPHLPSHLPRLLTRAGPLPAAHARDGEAIQSGRLYVAPPDQHLTLTRGAVRVQRGPKEHGLRPAIDPLFRSAAQAYGPHVVGVILTGLLDDGTAGLVAVKLRGGLAVVQVPNEASYASMPRSALKYLEVDYCLSLTEMAPVLVRLTLAAPAPRGRDVMAQDSDRDMELINQDIAAAERGHGANRPSGISCPDCGGTVWQFRNGELTHFQCRVGHRYSPESILAQHRDTLERTLWAAVRMLEEQASLARELANLARQSPTSERVEGLESEAQEAAWNAERLRQMLLRHHPSGASEQQ